MPMPTKRSLSELELFTDPVEDYDRISEDETWSKLRIQKPQKQREDKKLKVEWLDEYSRNSDDEFIRISLSKYQIYISKNAREIFGNKDRVRVGVVSGKCIVFQPGGKHGSKISWREDSGGLICSKPLVGRLLDEGVERDKRYPLEVKEIGDGLEVVVAYL